MGDSTKPPAEYPSTDGAERRAAILFQSKLNLDRVKPEIRVADKVPNHDGTLEVLDEKRHPLGLFVVQLKKISRNERSYDCPVELVGYSSQCSAPFILICVDTDERRVFWKHIHALMPEAKLDQQTFTIKFSDTDVISEDEIYLRRWIELAREYSQRVADAPKLKQNIEHNVTLPGISLKDREFFQRYIGEINNLLDNDFISVKELLFADVWKLGVGIQSVSGDALIFQLFKISYGNPSPLVRQVEDVEFDPAKWDSAVFSRHWSTRDFLGEPTTAAKRLVLDHVEKAFRGWKFAIHGAELAKGTIFSFMERHAHMFGLPEADTYTLAALQNGLFNELPSLCSSFAEEAFQSIGTRAIRIDFEMISSMVLSGRIKKRTDAKAAAPWALFSSRSRLKAVREAIEYLMATGVETVSNPLARPSRPPRGRMIWSLFSREEEIHNAQFVLSHTLAEYSAFIRGNHLRFHSSPYLDATTTIAFLYCPSNGDEKVPALGEFHIANPNFVLPKVVFQLVDNLSFHFGKDFTIQINGQAYSPGASSISEASFLVHRQPMLSSVYRLLANDLADHYSMRNIHVQVPP